MPSVATGTGLEDLCHRPGNGRREPTPSDREVLTGLVERVTYQNAENGFCVLRVKARGYRELVTLVGHAAAISAGEWIQPPATGSTTAPTVSNSRLETSAPTSLEGKIGEPADNVVPQSGAEP
jgi:exodeoxyribonuclease V alpha subunit